MIPYKLYTFLRYVYVFPFFSQNVVNNNNCIIFCKMCVSTYTLIFTKLSIMLVVTSFNVF